MAPVDGTPSRENCSGIGKQVQDHGMISQREKLHTAVAQDRRQVAEQPLCVASSGTSVNWRDTLLPEASHLSCDHVGTTRPLMRPMTGDTKPYQRVTRQDHMTELCRSLLRNNRTPELLSLLSSRHPAICPHSMFNCVSAACGDCCIMTAVSHHSSRARIQSDACTHSAGLADTVGGQARRQKLDFSTASCRPVLPLELCGSCFCTACQQDPKAAHNLKAVVIPHRT